MQAKREPLLGPLRQVQPQLAVHPPQPFRIPEMRIEPQSLATFPEAPATLGHHERDEGGDHGRIPSRPIHEAGRENLPTSGLNEALRYRASFDTSIHFIQVSGKVKDYLDGFFFVHILVVTIQIRLELVAIAKDCLPPILE